MLKVASEIANKHILVIDDQGTIRSLYKLVLKEIGLKNVSDACDGKDALIRLTQSAFDLVVCDWNMPHLTGVQLLERVRACPETENLPFLMATSAAELDAVKQAQDLNVSDYMIKPFQPMTFVEKVTSLLQTTEYQRQRYQPPDMKELREQSSQTKPQQD